MAKAPLLSGKDLETGAGTSRPKGRPAQEPIPSVVGSWTEVGCQKFPEVPLTLRPLQPATRLLPWEEHNTLGRILGHLQDHVRLCRV